MVLAANAAIRRLLPLGRQDDSRGGNPFIAGVIANAVHRLSPELYLVTVCITRIFVDGAFLQLILCRLS